MSTQPHEVPANMTVAVDASGHQLDHSHRCDKCGARAYVRIILESNCLDLYFCRHDWLANRKALLPKCAYVNDETRALFDGIKDDHWVEGKAVNLPPRQKQPWEDK